MNSTPHGTGQTPASDRTRDVDTRDGRLRVHVFGEGAPSLFLHGLSARGRSWAGVASRFVRGHTDWCCWLPDLLGRGESDARPELSYALPAEVDRLHELITAMSQDRDAQTEAEGPQLIVGHSQGAAMALALAASDSRVRALVLSNPVTANIRRPLVLGALRPMWVRALIARGVAPLHHRVGRAVLRRAGGPYFQAPDEMIRAYAAPYAERDRALTLLRLLADWRPADLEGRVPSRRLSVHVVAGAHDPRVPVAAAERLARDMDAAFTVVDDGGHVLPEQHPDLLAKIVGEIADGIRASAA